MPPPSLPPSYGLLLRFKKRRGEVSIGSALPVSAPEERAILRQRKPRISTVQGDDTKVSELSGSREPKGDILGIEREFAPLELMEDSADDPYLRDSGSLVV